MLKIKLELVMAMLYISVVHMQERPSREFDFNNVNTILEFETCTKLNDVYPMLAIKSYAEVLSPPLSGRNSSFHLSYVDPGFSCMQTREFFYIDPYVEISVSYYLKADVEDRFLFQTKLDFGLRDALDKQYAIDAIQSKGTNANWDVRRMYKYSTHEQAKVRIAATMSTNATLAIEYLRIGNATTTPTVATPPTVSKAPPTAAISTTQSSTVTTKSTENQWESEVTTEQRNKATEKPSKRNPINIFNIYNFAASYFNFTSN